MDEVVAATVGLVTGIVGLATAIVGLRLLVRSGRRTQRDIAQVHVLVNSRLDVALAEVKTLVQRVDQLSASIVTDGGIVPDSPEET